GGGAEKPKMEVAVQDDAVLLQRAYYDRNKALDQARDLEVTRIRTLVIWGRVPGSQPDSTTPPAGGRPTYDFSAWDSLIDDAAKRGIRVQLDLTGPVPAWAAGDRKVGVTRPDAQKFGVFAEQAARHFKGRVDRYSIWNEPNYGSWLKPQTEAADLYRNLYLAAYKGIKRADPAAHVLIGETSPYELAGRAIAPLKFLRDVTCRTTIYAPAKRCPTLVADGYAQHPYDFVSPPERPHPGADNVTIGSLDRLTRALDKLAEGKALTTPAGKPLDMYLTEFGYFASGPAAPPPKQRASWLARAFDIASRNPRVREMLQYILVSPPNKVRFDTGVITPQGQPTAAYTALRDWAHKAAAAGSIDKPDGPIELHTRPAS
ncbi:MAG TPA: cellulase family glycosylhydrolase, partial [Thermoleophilaceae bacterium]